MQSVMTNRSETQSQSDGRDHARSVAFIAKVTMSPVLLILMLRVLALGLYLVPSASMAPTIETGDFLLGEKFSNSLGMLSAGEIVTFESSESLGITLVKRVVAVGGQAVDIRNGRLWVGGKPLDEPYVIGSTKVNPESGIAYPHVVAEDCVWVMGDNREASRDSRTFGDVPLASVSSCVVLRYWPPHRVGLVG